MMHPTLSEDQEFFRETTHKFLAAEMPLDDVRALYENQNGFDRSWWRQAAELGWASMFVPEAFGGGSLSGGPAADAVIVAEEMGRMVAPGPFLPVNVVAAGVAWSDDDLHGELLEGLVGGDVVATWAFAEQGGCWSQAAFTTSVQIDGDSVVVNGSKCYVEAAGASDVLLVTARTGSGVTQVLVPVDSSGVSVVRGRSVDMTRRFGRVSFDQVRVPRSALVGEVGTAGDAVERQRVLALALQCAEMVGSADRVLEFTLEYGSDRFAFGRPIVSFQALKHRIADMLTHLEGAKAVSDALAAAIDAGDPDVSQLASVAKAYVGEHATNIVDDCVQITGGVGVTWEHDIHMYSRRVITDRALYGTPEDHKLAISERLIAAAV
jgi:alkylation response protein AidB-like acyl-CoA dehydrogenase